MKYLFIFLIFWLFRIFWFLEGIIIIIKILNMKL
jgi:hypothetical protein